MNANVDLIGREGAAQGEMAAYMSQQGRLEPGQMRPYIGNDGRAYVTVYKGRGNPNDLANYAVQPIQTNATLRRDEWKQLDDAVLGISEQRLGGVQDLIDKNLTFNLGNAMGTTVLEWHDISDALDADLTMDGISRARGDRPAYSTHYLPLPIIHADYEINARVLNASRSLGNPLDTTLAERAARKVNQKLENMLFTDVDYSFGGGTIYSYLNYPDINSVSLSKNWNASDKTPAEILADLIAMKQASIDALHFGPWMVYVPTAYDTVLDEDYDVSGTSTQTIRQRLEAVSGIQGVKVIDTLPANTVLLVQMTSDVVRLVRGMGIQNVEWKTEGGMISKYKVMTIQVPQVRSDQEGHCGIVKLS
jgi:hypothetical protein